MCVYQCMQEKTHKSCQDIWTQKYPKSSILILRSCKMPIFHQNISINYNVLDCSYRRLHQGPGSINLSLNMYACTCAGVLIFCLYIFSIKGKDQHVITLFYILKCTFNNRFQFIISGGCKNHKYTSPARLDVSNI